MSTSIKLSEDFMRIPKVNDDGENWVIYKARFIWSIDARGYVDHIDGSSVAPVNPVTRTDVA